MVDFAPDRIDCCRSVTDCKQQIEPATPLAVAEAEFPVAQPTGSCGQTANFSCQLSGGKRVYPDRP